MDSVVCRLACADRIIRITLWPARPDCERRDCPASPEPARVCRTALQPWNLTLNHRSSFSVSSREVAEIEAKSKLPAMQPKLEVRSLLSAQRYP